MICPWCDGTGCGSCHGTGETAARFPWRCPECDANGVDPEGDDDRTVCPECGAATEYDDSNDPAAPADDFDPDSIPQPEEYHGP